MIDLKEDIKRIIYEKTKVKEFNILENKEYANELIQKLIEDYEISEENLIDFSKGKKQGELIFLAAPTGAGKDNLVRKFMSDNKEKNYIELNMDMFRYYYSFFINDDLNDKNFADKTNEFSYEIYRTIQEILLTKFYGLNIIITGTLREKEWIEDTFRRFKSNKNTDYTIKLVSLAVPKKDSQISVIKRYIGIVDMQSSNPEFVPGTARYTSLKYHDETYDNFPDNFKYFENKFISCDDKIIDAIEVYIRTNSVFDYDMVYNSEKKINNFESALSTILFYRMKESKIDKIEVFELLKKIEKNNDYLRKQNLIKDIINDIIEVIDYKKKDNVIEKKGDEPDF